MYVTASNRISDKIYTELQSNHYCGRRLNGTHQMGCSSNLGGNLGVLWMIQEPRDINHVLTDGPTPPYIVVLERRDYTRKNILTFKEHRHRVAGVIFLDRDHDDSRLRSTPFSPEDVCPNRYSGLYANDSKYENCKQNAWQQESPVSGLLYDDIPFPIFLINDKKSVSEIETCFNDYNILKLDRSQAAYPLCGVQLDSFMTAAGNSDICMNSHSYVDELLQSDGRRCFHVSNKNIYAYYKPAIGNATYNERTKLYTPDVVPSESVILLVTKLSSLSMFSEISPGADSTLTSIITLLAVAEALGRVKNKPEVVESERNIAFVVLDSEPFDYTGSNRMLYEMKRNNFPLSPYDLQFEVNSTHETVQNLNLSSIDLVINLDQIASYPNEGSIYLHSDPENKDTDKLERIFDVMQKVSKKEDVKLNQVDRKLPLPPASVQQFIKASRTPEKDSRLMGMVLSNYDRTYSNLFYHSIYDDSHNIDQVSREKLIDHISKVASFVAKSLYKLSFRGQPDVVSVDKNIIKQLLHCYIAEADCELFTRALDAGQKLPKEPIQTYKDPTKRSDDMNGAITANLLAYFIGDKMTQYNISECYRENYRSLTYSYKYVNGKGEPIRDHTSGECIRSQVVMLSATSPAFQLGEYGYIINQSYPAWTVSLNSIRNPVRLYLVPSPLYQWSMFVFGVVMTIASFMIVHQIKTAIIRMKSEPEMQQDVST